MALSLEGVEDIMRVFHIFFSREKNHFKGLLHCYHTTITIFFLPHFFCWHTTPQKSDSNNNKWLWSNILYTVKCSNRVMFHLIFLLKRDEKAGENGMFQQIRYYSSLSTLPYVSKGRKNHRKSSSVSSTSQLLAIIILSMIQSRWSFPIQWRQNEGSSHTKNRENKTETKWYYSIIVLCVVSILKNKTDKRQGKIYIQNIAFWRPFFYLVSLKEIEMPQYDIFPCTYVHLIVIIIITSEQFATRPFSHLFSEIE